MAILQNVDIDYARNMYAERLRFLRKEIEQIVAEALVNAAFEDEAMSRLNLMEKEIDGIGDCISVLDSLAKRST